jgi:hypothetical protein
MMMIHRLILESIFQLVSTSNQKPMEQVTYSG